MKWRTWLWVAALAASSAGANAQCAPAPDSSYFFRNLTIRRAADLHAVVHDFTLLEHRKGYVVASYRLVDESGERWLRDVYKVEDGKWRLASTEPGLTDDARPAS